MPLSLNTIEIIGKIISKSNKPETKYKTKDTKVIIAISYIISINLIISNNLYKYRLIGSIAVFIHANVSHNV